MLYQDTMLRLYDYYRSSASYRVRIALNYKELPYQLEEVHLVNDGGQQFSPAYREINPQSRVPSLVTEDGHIITQSMAILEFLEQMQPTPALVPSDPYRAAQVRSLANLIACDVHPLNNLAVLKYLRGQLKVTDKQKQHWYAHWVQQGFEAFEKQLQATSGMYCVGDNISLADVCLAPQVYNALRFEVDINDYVLIKAIYQRCMNHSAFTKADPDVQPGAQSN